MNYKTKSLIGVGVAIGGILTAIVIRRRLLNKGMEDKFISVKNAKGIYIKSSDPAIGPNYNVGTVTGLWFDEKKGHDICIEDLSLGDIGRLGEAFLDVDDSTKDTRIEVQLHIFRNPLRGYNNGAAGKTE